MIMKMVYEAVRQSFTREWKGVTDVWVCAAICLSERCRIEGAWSDYYLPMREFSFALEHSLVLSQVELRYVRSDEGEYVPQYRLSSAGVVGLNGGRPAHL